MLPQTGRNTRRNVAAPEVVAEAEEDHLRQVALYLQLFSNNKKPTAAAAA